MKFRLLTLGALSLMLGTSFSTDAMAESKEKQLAFPGAEGFGRYTTGGRGGTVYHVTTLEDTGEEGSFRWACNQKGPRTIIFDVSGTIYLTSPLRLSNGDVTIAGQTSPGGGICIADYPFSIGADNVIIRYMRFRCGNRHVDEHEGDGLGGMDLNDVIIDHCSVSWSVDECLSVYGSRNLTVQWCIAAQSMVNAGHSKGSHGYGGNWGGSGASYHHNLIIHHTSRTPRLGPRPSTQTDERMDMRNNVIYNWGGNGCYGGEGMNVNIVNNYYKPGPATENRSETIQRRIAGIGIRTSEYTGHNTDSPNEWDKMWHVWGKFYVDGNVNSKYDDVTNDNWTYGMYNQITNGSGVDNTYTQATRDTMRINEPIDFVAVTTHSAADAFDRVLKYAGCRRTESSRDALDIILVNDAREGLATFTGRNCDQGFINSQDDCGGWPVLATANAPADLDNDGISDQWEDFNGLDPSNPDDGNEVGADGYTNLERYLNSLVNITTINQNAGGTQMGYIIYEDGTTSITGIEDTNASQYGANATADNNIYFLNGTIAKQNATMEDYDSLAKGIYIHKGKKVVVK